MKKIIIHSKDEERSLWSFKLLNRSYNKKMGIKQSKEDKITELANKMIRKFEHKNKRKLENSEIASVFEEAEKRVEIQEQDRELKRKKIRNRVIAILGSIGLAVGGHLLLNGGDDPKNPDNQPTVETTNTGNPDKSKEYRDTLKTDPTTTTIQEPSEETQETALIDQILEEYNSNLPDENKISKSDLRYNMSRKYGRRKYYKTYLRRWSNNL